MKKLLVVLFLLCIVCSAVSAEDVFVLMNVPYEDLYAAELSGNSIPVDAVTSATRSKALNDGTVGGTYHQENDEAVTILGVTIPVKVNGPLDAYTAVDSVEELFGAPSYSYIILEDVPAYYKELSDGSFGKFEGLATENIADASGVVETMGKRGDYKITMKGFSVDTSAETILGVILHTNESDYGLRALENIWKGNELAVNVGYTEMIKDVNPTYPEHYRSLEGATVTSVDYITDQKIYHLDTEIYLPLITGCKLKASDAPLAEGSTVFELKGELPEGYDPEYSVNLNGAEINENAIPFSAENKPGSYTLTLIDKSGVYETLTASFVLSVDELPVAYDAENGVLTGNAVEDYVANIETVSVNGQSYKPKSMKIVGSDGKIDTTVKALEDAGIYQIIINSVGYPELSFELSK